MCTLLRICPLSAWVHNGQLLYEMAHWDGRIFLKNLSVASFNKDLSNEPTFGWIHLAGQYLYVRVSALTEVINRYRRVSILSNVQVLYRTHRAPFLQCIVPRPVIAPFLKMYTYINKGSEYLYEPFPALHLFYLSQAAIGIWILGYTLPFSFRTLDNL